MDLKVMGLAIIAVLAVVAVANIATTVINVNGSDSHQAFASKGEHHGGGHAHISSKVGIMVPDND